MSLSPEIQKIRERIASQGWPKIVKSINISGIHGFLNKQILFQFPVCAIVGENGTGKSTILKLLACAYKNEDSEKTFFPSKFFPDTKWDKFRGVKIGYQLMLGQNNPIQHNIVKLTQRWRGLEERKTNNVFYFDINRIQAIESLIGYSKLAKNSIKETGSRNLLPETMQSLSDVMGRNYLAGRYAKTSADNYKEIGILKLNFGEVSKFHQGAGESIAFDLISAIEKIPDYSFILIDEVESSLHPRAQRRLMRQLFHLARVKQLQIIISTHSPYILNELPSEARILLTRINEEVEVVYAPSTEFCLSQIDDELHYELYALVEDAEAATILTEIVRNKNPNLLKRLGIIPVGPANIIQKFEEFYASGKCPFKIIGVVDADQNMQNIIKLPGSFAPEKQIVQDIASGGHYNKLFQVLGVDEQTLKNEIQNVQTMIDYTKWVEKLSQKLVVSQETLWNCLTSVWVKNCISIEQQNSIVEAISERLQDQSGTA